MPKAKRKVVEPSVFRELQGYSYTLRALRTEAIQDAPAHMLEGAIARFEQFEEDEEKNSGKSAQRQEDEYEDTAGPTEAEAESGERSKSSERAIPTRKVPWAPKHTFDRPGDRLSAFPNNGSISDGPSFVSLWPDTFTLKYTSPFMFEEEIEACIRSSLQLLGRTVKIEGFDEEPASDPGISVDPQSTTTTSDPTTTNALHPSSIPNHRPFEVTPEFLSSLTSEVTATVHKSLSHLAKERYETGHYGSKNFVLPPSLSGKRVLKMLGKAKWMDKK